MTDAGTGEPLPAATILLEGSYRGTITNPEGHFSIITDELPVVLTIRYIGFETETVEVDEATDFPVPVSLSPSVTEMDEIVVTDRDPGLTIMERVIERKKIWRAELENYQVEAHTRQVLENDTSIVSISESRSIAYWDAQRGHREVQLSARQTSNLTEEQNFAGVSYLPNFYDDDIEIAGYRMVGITHPDALSFYHFRLLETLQMDGKPVYKIEVTPRRIRQPVFEGIAYVLGRDYALLEVDLKPNEIVSFPPPVQDFDLSYRQQFSNYGRDFWLPVDMRAEGVVRIGMVGLQFPSMKFRQVSRLSGYEVNTAIPDSVYEGNEVLVKADSSQAEIQFRQIEQVPLTSEERRAYETIDSTQTLEEAFKPEGFLARMAERDERDGREGFLGDVGRVLPDGLGIRGRFNRTDGFHLGLKYERRFHSAGLTVRGFSGYSFYSGDWDYGGEAEQRLFEAGRSRFSFMAGYKTVTDTRFPSLLYTKGMNSITTLLGSEDYFDYFRNESLYGGLKIEDVLPGAYAELTARHELHRSFDRDDVYDYSLFGWHKTRRENRGIEEGTLNSFRMKLGYGTSSYDYGISGRRAFQISGEWSDGAFGSDFDFLNAAMSLDWNFRTFYPRRLFANTLDLHLSAGKAFGDLPLQRFGAVDGSLFRFTPFGSLKTRQGIPYEGSRYWLATAEHNFRTLPFEFLGLKALADRGWGIILFGGAGYADADGKYPDSDRLMTSDGVHTEIGASLNSIFGIFRLDFAKRLDEPGTYFGFSVPRYF